MAPRSHRARSNRLLLGGSAAASVVLLLAEPSRAEATAAAPTGPTPAAAAPSPPSGGAAASSEKPAAEDAPRQSDDAAARDWETAPATRRSGFTAGLLVGISFGRSFGYPNDLAKIGDPRYRTNVNGIGSDLGLWIGGALADWFTFGFGVMGDSTGNKDFTAATSAFVFHIEAFPLFEQGGAWRDVAFVTDVGPGSGLIFRGKDRHDEVASGPSLSIIHAGVQWELQRWAGGHIANGPVLLGEYEWSDSMVRYGVVAGFRMAFYGGP